MDYPTIAEYKSALNLAVRAPSLHNSQPWQWEIQSERLVLHADRSRQLPATDVDSSALLLGCGAALRLASLGLENEGWSVEIERFPLIDNQDVLAYLNVTGRHAANEHIAGELAAAEQRHSERRPFRTDEVPDELLEDLRKAAAVPGFYVDFVTRPDRRLDLAVAISWADRYERADERYQAELSAWTRVDDSSPDGVPASEIPHQVGAEPRHTDVPIRDFEHGRQGRLPIAGSVDEQPVFAVLFSTEDDNAARLQAGEVLAAILVRAQQHGLASSLISQPVDFPGVRARFRALMAWPDYPRMVLRLGWPPVGEPGHPTPRRSVEDVILSVSESAS